MGPSSKILLSHPAARFASLAFTAAVALSATVAHAGTAIIYSNVDNFSGYGFQNERSGGGFSTMALDDVTISASSYGTPVTGVEFSVFNAGPTSISASVILSVYEANGANGGPGTDLGNLEFNAYSFASGVGLYNATLSSAFFTPSAADGTTYWIGEAFTGATNSNLNELGEGIFAPPTVGSSTDTFYETANPWTGGNNPAGARENFGGTPPADFGFALSGTAPAAVTPEPGSLSLLGLGLVSMGGLLRVNARKAARKVFGNA